MTTVLITCAGGGERWTGKEPKQLVDIDGTSLLDRTIKQCHERAATPTVATWDPRLCRDGTEVVDPGKTRWLVETILKCKPYWEPLPLIVLFGDVFFSEHAMNLLFDAAKEGRHCWIGRRSQSWLSGNSGEVFGFTWAGESTERLTSILEQSVAHAEASPGPNDKSGSPVGSVWQTYRLLIGHAIDTHGFEGKIWADVVDFTEDFDDEETYFRWSAARARRFFCQKPVGLGNYDRPPGVGPVT